MLVKKFITGPLEVNCYLVGDEQTRTAFIIDPGYYNLKLVEFAKQEKFSIKHIILTHGHGDHMCGVPSYRKKYPGIKVIANINDRDLLMGKILNFSKEISGRELSLEADEYIEGDQTMKIDGIKVSFMHTPGHTKGSMSVLIDNYVFCGDTLFFEAIGRTDFPGGSAEELLKSIKTKLFALSDDTIVMPGHMSETSIGYEKVNNPFL